MPVARSAEVVDEVRFKIAGVGRQSAKASVHAACANSSAGPRPHRPVLWLPVMIVTYRSMAYTSVYQGRGQMYVNIARISNLRSIHLSVLGTVFVATNLLIPIVPAHALIQKSGSQSCAVGSYVQLAGKGQGTISFYAPVSTFRYSEYHTAIYTGYYTSHLRSASWTITSDDILVDSGTYATCVPGNARATRSDL